MLFLAGVLPTACPLLLLSDKGHVVTMAAVYDCYAGRVLDVLRNRYSCNIGVLLLNKFLLSSAGLK